MRGRISNQIYRGTYKYEVAEASDWINPVGWKNIRWFLEYTFRGYFQAEVSSNIHGTNKRHDFIKSKKNPISATISDRSSLHAVVNKTVVVSKADKQW